MFNKLFNLFKSEEPSKLQDFGLMAVDMHSHLIPGIDDGVKDIDESLFLIRQLKELGFKKLITTPHVVSGGYNNTTEIILEGRDKVRAALKANAIDIAFDASAEYYCDETMYEKIEKKDLITFGNNYMLMEFSYMAKPNCAWDVIYKLQVANYKVILAHPERYPFFYENDFRAYHDLKDRGLYLQLNIGSLSGKYGKGAKITAERMIDENMVDFIGTDLHNARHAEHLKTCLNLKYLEKILTSDKLKNKTLL